MKPSPSPAATRARRSDETELTHQIRCYSEYVRNEADHGPNRSEIANILSCHAPFINEWIEKTQLTPSQSDVEAAREWLFKHYGFRNLNVMSHEVDALASLLASRGTRALTEEEAATVRTARRWKAENNLNNHEQNLLAIISRLTGEPSA